MSKFLTLDEAKELGLIYHIYRNGLYKYEKDGKETLIEDGKVIISGVDWVWWYDKGVYRYEKDGLYTLIEDGKVLVSGVKWVWWFAKGMYKYEKDGKTYNIGVTNE
jgi:uncharacterized membrane protein